jgi:hypothetical protein
MATAAVALDNARNLAPTTNHPQRQRILIMRFVNSVVLAASAVAIAVSTAPSATADDQQKQYCINSVSSTRCVKSGDAEINSSIPAPPAGPWAVYGPFWGGN